MKTCKRFFLLAFLFLATAYKADAQFYTGETEPASTKWYKMQTPHFSLIYPNGLDSLSRVYGNLLELYRPAEYLSSGYLPGEKYKRRTPVLIRPYTGVSNGMVVWTPKRMELYTLPAYDGAEASPWAKNLVIHESRHLSQMQLGYDNAFRPFYLLFGEILPGIASALYPGQHLMEGDAVIAETALTTYGRGRSGYFLNYYMSAFDDGDYRNWYRWRYGSFKKYAPDHYALGYLTLAGVRCFYDKPRFMAEYFDKVSRKPWRMFNMQKSIKDATGKNFKSSFQDIMDSYRQMWNEEAEVRKPFIKADPLTPMSSFYTSYTDITPVGGDVYAIKSGNIDLKSLVRISPDGTEEMIRTFAAHAGSIAYSEQDNRLYWSEPIADPRWRMRANSRIRYIDLGDRCKRAKDLTKKGRYYNPSVSEDGSLIAATEFPTGGGSAIVILDSKKGQIVSKMQAPDSLQFVRAVWNKDGVIVSGISNSGTGLYSIKSENGRPAAVYNLVAPVPAAIKDLYSSKDGIIFTSDRTGVDEIYLLGSDGPVRLTSTRYGASGGRFNNSGDTLFFTSLSGDGRYVYKTATTGLIHGRDRFSEVHKYRIAEDLTAQEKALAAENNSEWPDYSLSHKTTFSEPKRYRRLTSIPNFHSWLPVYVGKDNFADVNFNAVYETVKIGATAFFQNILGTAYGSIGYSFSKAPNNGKSFHAGHIKFTYSGLYPVLEFGSDFNDRSAFKYSRLSGVFRERRVERVRRADAGYPHFSASLNAYIPLRFTSGGLSRGLTPRIRYTFNNDLYDKSEVLLSYKDLLNGSSEGIFSGYSGAGNVFMQTITASLSGYIMQNNPPMLDYPRLGIGMEAGYNARIALSDMYSSNIYGLIYGYTPGICKTHGLKLSALYQHRLSDGSIFNENYVSPKPRGFKSYILSDYIGAVSGNQLKLSVDYPMPIYVGDISWFSPITYITHFVVSPHIDYTFMSIGGGTLNGGLASLGVNILAKAANFIWIPFRFEFGVEFDWNTGPSYDSISAIGIDLNRFFIGPLMRTSF